MSHNTSAVYTLAEKVYTFPGSTFKDWKTTSRSKKILYLKSSDGEYIKSMGRTASIGLAVCKAVFYGIVSAENPSIEEIDLKKYPPSLGITIELCAGIVDKEKSWPEIAREEILEECGYNVQVNRIEEVMTYRSGVGSQGSKQKMYYCEVTDADKSSSGGGVDDEIIEVVEYSIDDARKLVKQGAVNNSPPSCLLGIMWFLMNKAPKTSV